MGDNITAKIENTEALLNASKEVGLEETKYYDKVKIFGNDSNRSKFCS
jgi:hypothetical protein